LKAFGYDVWSAVENGYTTSTTPLIDLAENKLSYYDSMAMSTILFGLEESYFVKVMHCTSVKEMQDKLQKIYGGDNKVKKKKLQTHKGQFETLTMKEEESVVDYFLRVDKIINTIKGLGEEVKETIILQNFLRSLPSIFNPKISSIEEMKDRDNMTMDELHGILIAYEMRIENDKQEKIVRKEETFKASKNKNTEEKKTSDISDSESNEE
jgi:phosphoglucomutase